MCTVLISLQDWVSFPKTIYLPPPTPAPHHHPHLTGAYTQNYMKAGGGVILFWFSPYAFLNLLKNIGKSLLDGGRGGIPIYFPHPPPLPWHALAPWYSWLWSSKTFASATVSCYVTAIQNRTWIQIQILQIHLNMIQSNIVFLNFRFIVS